jgi:microsomal dipeptidase-like Zn-dependent dipeptidase
MYHPLVDDPRKIRDQDLENKIQDLSKKYHIAARMGQGGICAQIVTALNMYKNEQQRRQIESMQNLVKKQNKDLDDLINVNQ